MKNKFLSIVFVLSVLCAFMPLIASAATSGTCGENVTWTLDDYGTLTISGTGNMTRWGNTGSNAPVSYTHLYNNSNSDKQGNWKSQSF